MGLNYWNFCPLFFLETDQKWVWKWPHPIFTLLFLAFCPLFLAICPLLKVKVATTWSAKKPLNKGFSRPAAELCPLTHFFLLFNVIKNLRYIYKLGQKKWPSGHKRIFRQFLQDFFYFWVRENYMHCYERKSENWTLLLFLFLEGEAPKLWTEGKQKNSNATFSQI